MVAVAAVAVSAVRRMFSGYMAGQSALLCIAIYFTRQAPSPAHVAGLQAELQQDAVEEGVVARLEVARPELRLICPQHMRQPDLDRMNCCLSKSSAEVEYTIFKCTRTFKATFQGGHDRADAVHTSPSAAPLAASCRSTSDKMSLSSETSFCTDRKSGH
jgi:hypothetical protein